MRKILLAPMVLTLLLVVACTPSEEVVSDLDVTNQNVVSNLVEISAKNDGNSKKMQPDIYGDCIVYLGLVNEKATFNPESDPFDELYALGDGLFFKGGVPLISESKPGDQDYNGGRWHMNVLTDPGNAWKYANSCSVEDIIADGDLADFTSTDAYFSCPMLPRKQQ